MSGSVLAHGPIIPSIPPELRAQSDRPSLSTRWCPECSAGRPRSPPYAAHRAGRHNRVSNFHKDQERRLPGFFSLFVRLSGTVTRFYRRPYEFIIDRAPAAPHLSSASAFPAASGHCFLLAELQLKSSGKKCLNRFRPDRGRVRAEAGLFHFIRVSSTSRSVFRLSMIRKSGFRFRRSCQRIS